MQFNSSGSFAGSSAITLSTTRLGFFGASLTGQYSTTGQTAGYSPGIGTSVSTAGTFTGGLGSTACTIGDIVRALKTLGLLAQ